MSDSKDEEWPSLARETGDVGAIGSALIGLLVLGIVGAIGIGVLSVIGVM